MSSLSTGRQFRVSCRKKLLILIPFLLLGHNNGHAAEFQWNASGALNAGAIFLTESADSAYMFQGNLEAAGVSDSNHANPSGARNADDGRINYRNRGLAATPLTLDGRLELSYGNLSAVVAGKAWYDYFQTHHDVRLGNTAGGYQADSPLNDSHFQSLARFQGVALTEAFLGLNLELDGRQTQIRAGQQFLPWGESRFFIGGVGSINPLILPALRMPSQANRLATPLLTAELSLSERWQTSGFYQLASQSTILEGCGTAFVQNDYIAKGCAGAVPHGRDDRYAYQNGLFVERIDDDNAKDMGQFGVSLNYEDKGTKLALYAMNIHSRRPYTSIITNSYTEPNEQGLNPGWRPPTDSTYDSSRNTQYFAEFPEDIQIYGGSFRMKTALSTQVYGEYALRVGQPIQLAAADLIPAFVNDPAMLEDILGASIVLGDDALAAAPGSHYRGYDRYNVSQLTLGLLQPVPTVLGADHLIIMGEAGFKYVHDLPGLDERRYNKVDVYGSDLVPGSQLGCQIGSLPRYQDKACSSDGYTTDFAWGYRLRLQLTYTNPIPGLTLKPSLMFGHDVKGWSYDQNFFEGRLIGSLGLQATFGKRYRADLVWGQSGNSPYAGTDRDFASVSVGMQF